MIPMTAFLLPCGASHRATRLQLRLGHRGSRRQRTAFVSMEAKSRQETLQNGIATRTGKYARVAEGSNGVAEFSRMLEQWGVIGGDQDAESQSIRALLRGLTESRANSMLHALQERTHHVALVLEHINILHNLAATLRTSDAAGIQDVHAVHARRDSTVSLLDALASEHSAQAVSKGCHKWLSIHEYSSTAACVAQLHAQGYKVLVSSLNPQAVSLDDIDYSDQKVALVFGNEVQGVTEEMLQLADGYFTIPMRGFVESMNVSVAVAISIYDAYKRAKQSVPRERFFLTPEKKRAVLKSWLTQDRKSLVNGKVMRPIPKGHVSFGLSKLGLAFENRLVASGVLVLHDTSSHEPQVKNVTDIHARVALNPELGVRLASFFQRRKNGALGDNDFGRRMTTSNVGVVTTETLLLASALCRFKSSCDLAGLESISLKSLSHYVQGCTNLVHETMRECFDNGGRPIAINSELSQSRMEIAYSKCFDAAFRALTNLVDSAYLDTALSESYVKSALDSATLHDVVRVVEQCLNVQGCAALLFGDSYADKLLEQFPLVEAQIRQLDRHGIRGENEFLSAATRSVRADMLCREELSFEESEHVEEMSLLHLALRFLHIARLVNELHRTCWDREIRGSAKRLSYDSRHAPFECMLVDTFIASYQDAVHVGERADVRLAAMDSDDATRLAFSRCVYELLVLLDSESH
ncbi:tRNA (guanosine(18)-2'-O)-methyltransferase [Porphyridium purpureum]|uniref:tRNA (Guanosine(18)-2'-O)-methyltransferase n=1 Tax=Porphyridium purpureum TaxID=35688 RepID=A0A5J4YXS1_PORPP|nr:tRNA (guanosine(18)-2'-O)-methyltransferase [Porphyridium purpureum]|eukprot:POR2976..scf209_3